jgi:putative endonuclease
MPDRRERGHAAERSGRRAELAAEILLRCKFYRILARRMRNRAGEIDIVAKDLRGIVCFVEVKTRPGALASVEAVTVKQRGRIQRAAEIYLAGKKPPRGVRFDVISIVPGRLPRHIRDAWRPQ